MNVLHISAATSQSGAGAAALKTHEALLKCGVNSKILFLKGQGSKVPGVSNYANVWYRRVVRLAFTHLDSFPLKFYPKRNNQIFSPGIFGISLRNFSLLRWADIIHIHWANHGFIDHKEIIKWNRPIVWTLRDMWAFTGGCHHSFGCERFADTCGMCPVLKSSKLKDLSYYVLKQKQNNNLFKFPIQWVAISSWMKSQALKSKILNKANIEVIYSGIDTLTFNNTYKQKARLALGLPLHDKIVLLGAGNLREEYKGFSYAINSLRNQDSNLLILTFGSGYILEDEIPQRIINLGFIKEDKKLALIYNSADVFLAPSIAEAFGKTFAEAQSCSLPVVCFRDTGPEDIIEHKKTGYLAEYKDQEDLNFGLNFCLKSNFDSNYIRQRSIELFDINNTAKRYKSLYENFIVDGSNSSTQDAILEKEY